MKIDFFDSSQSLPIKRFHSFNKYMMMASDVGSDFGDYDARITRLRDFIKSDLKEEAEKELINFKQSLFNGLNEISPSNFALAMLVKSIDGKPVSVKTDEEIEYIIDKLDKAGYTKKEREDKTSEVKKKWKMNWLFTFLSTLRIRGR